MEKKIRVRFAPSPTGGLHLGGVRTVLYNYLFAKQNKGTFIVRIEDTDQNRYVDGAEDYIFNCLKWAGLEPDESPRHGGAFGPYRQSERKPMYREYAEKLVAAGHAYYAFDTPEDLERMRQDFKTDENPSPQYDHTIRMKMRNSLTLSAEETAALLQAGTRHVVRIKIPDSRQVSFHDMIRGDVHFDTRVVDDKVLLKADGMPTYHLAVVVDDYLMQITHAFRGEEWLPSAPVHILLWEYLFGIDQMPQWAHLPLILGPQGKLSKRDGAKYGFPVFAMNWQDPKTNELTEGFREKGFLPEAFVNLLALLGWNDGSEREIFSKEELVEAFSMERVHAAGARFDYEKAKWFNHEWIKKTDAAALAVPVKQLLADAGIQTTDEGLINTINVVRDRCTLLPDFVTQTAFLFKAPDTWDLPSVKPKWNEAKQVFFRQLISNWTITNDWTAAVLENNFQTTVVANQLKPGEVLLPLRIMLVGGKFGPGVFDIAGLLGKEETLQRIEKALAAINA